MRLISQDMDAYETVYATKNFFLSHEIEIAKFMIADKSSYFEYFNFNSEIDPEQDKESEEVKNEEKKEQDTPAGGTDLPATCGVQLIQEYTHRFEITKEACFNSLCCFIWIDLDLAPTPRLPKHTSLASFPFGDERFPPNEESEEAKKGAPKEAPNHISSFYTEKSASYASNWMNPILILPNPRDVVVGDRIEVLTKVKLDSLKPSYNFQVYLERGETKESLGEIDLDYNNLYPDFAPLKG
jgi:hypothetical protein